MAEKTSNNYKRTVKKDNVIRPSLFSVRISCIRKIHADPAAAENAADEEREGLRMTAEKRTVLTAKAKGLRGAIAGAVIMGVFILFFDRWAMGNGTGISYDRTVYLGMMAVAPLYGFGYAFGYKKMIHWFARALHFSGEVTLAALIWWVLTGSKKGFVRGFILIMVIFCTIAGMAWMPGIPMGIRAIREENRNTLKRAAQAARGTQKHRKKFFREAGNPIEEAGRFLKSDRNEKEERNYGTQEGFTPDPEFPRPVKNPGSTLRCFGGEFAGASFDLSDGKELVIGRDPGRSSIVLSEGTVSRTHCIVRYSAADGCALVKDLSSNGTALLDGTPVPKDRFIKVAGGNGIKLGQNGPVFLFS